MEEKRRTRRGVVLAIATGTGLANKFHADAENIERPVDLLKEYSARGSGFIRGVRSEDKRLAPDSAIFSNALPRQAGDEIASTISAVVTIALA